ncbi:MAG: hypothetical protein WCI36_04060 [bacterium]
MKKIISLVLGCVLMMVAAASFAATFPTRDNNTVVSSDTYGVVQVKAAGEGDWQMILFCQDNLRAGCGNKFGVDPFEKNGDVSRYRIPKDAILDGQIAFNFKKGGLWLAIPDCRVKTAGHVEIGMSYFTADIAESGGAHFVYTGGGMATWSPISANGCDDSRAVAARKHATEKVAAEKAANNGSDQGAVATNQSAAAAHNSAAATNQSAAANNSSQANATSFLNINQVNDFGKGKGKKKSGNTAIIYAPNARQDVQNNNIRGNSADVKVYLNKVKHGKGGSGNVNVITYVAPTFQSIHIGVKGAENYDVHACTKCHHASAADDERARKMVLSQMSSAISGKGSKTSGNTYTPPAQRSTAVDKKNATAVERERMKEHILYIK